MEHCPGAPCINFTLGGGTAWARAPTSHAHIEANSEKLFLMQKPVTLVEELESHTLLAEISNGAATMESSLSTPQEVKYNYLLIA